MRIPALLPVLSHGFLLGNNVRDSPHNGIFQASTNSASSITEEDKNSMVETLIDLVQGEPKNESERQGIEDLILQLEEIDPGPSTDLPDSVFGYYNVSYTWTQKPKENPVGGKWTRKNEGARWKPKLWTVTKTMQHVLTPRSTAADDEGPNNSTVAQVVNLIVLKTFFGLIRLSVMLRGDAYRLSTSDGIPSNGRVLLPDLTNRTVQVSFDAPRIICGTDKTPARFGSLTIGPVSSVVLDTPFCNNRLRLGRGGTSGTRFVFCRLTNAKPAEQEVELLLKPRSISKKTLIVALLASFVFGLWNSVAGLRLARRIFGFAGMAVSLFLLARVSSSTGGIEDSRRRPIA